MNIVDTKQKKLHSPLSFDGGEKIPKRVMQTNHAFLQHKQKTCRFRQVFYRMTRCITGRSDGQCRVQSSILRWSG